MATARQRRDPLLSGILIVLFGLSLAGLGYTLLARTGGVTCTIAQCTLALYTAFFAVSAIGAVGIMRWKRWGVYAIGTASFSVAVIDSFQRIIPFEQYVLGFALLTGAALLIRPVWHDLD